MADINSFSIEEQELSYSFAFDPYGNQMRISCVCPQFHEWETTICDDLEKSSSDHMRIILSPKKLFELFTKFKFNQLNDYSKIILQKKMKAPDCPVSIEIITYAPFDQDQSDVKQILLEPKNISIEERNCKKIQQRDFQVENLSAIIKHTSHEINEIKEKMENYKYFDQQVTQKLEMLQSLIGDLKKMGSTELEKLDQDICVIRPHIEELKTNFKMAEYRLNAHIKESDEEEEQYTKEEIDKLFERKIVFTQEEINTMTAHCSLKVDTYTKAEIDALFVKKTDVYTKPEITNLINILANNATNALQVTKTQIDVIVNQKANTSDVYTKAEITALLAQYQKIA